MPLDRLQRWYYAQCNGDWEHQYGVTIQTCDNPGWLVKIDLVGTALETVPFDAIHEDVDEAGWQQSDRWLHCRVVGNVWQGAGDETKLQRILEVFLAWAEGSGS